MATTKEVDYARRIIDARAANPLANVDDDLIGRYQKVMANPELAALYGNDSYSQEAQKILAARAAAQTPQLPQPVDNSALIQSMFDQQGQAQAAQLNAARDQTNSDYQSQIDSAPETFRPKRNEVDVATARNIQRANEVAAAKGTAFSGGVASDQGAIVSTGENQKTALTQQEINLVQSLKKAISDNNKSTSMKQLELTAANQASKTAALIDESNRIYNANYQRSTDLFNQGIAQAGMTGYYNGMRTEAGRQSDISASQWLKTFNYSQERDKIADGQWLKNFEQNVKEADASRAIQWGNLKLNREQFEWSKDPTNPDNIYKVAQAAAKDAGDGAKEFESMFKKAWDMIGATKKGVDPTTGAQVDIPMFTQEQVAALIDQSPLDDEQALRLRRMLGIPDPK